MTLNNLFKRIRDSIIKDVFIADISFDISKAEKRIKLGFILVISGIIFLCFSKFTAFYYSKYFTYFSIIIFLFGIVLMFYDLFKVKYIIKVKEENAERELPFVAIYMSLITASGLSIKIAIDTIRELSVFKHFRKEFAFLKKIMLFYGYTVLDALDFVSRLHPSSMVREFYKSLVVSERTGGATYSYLVEKSKSYVKLLEDRVMRLIDNFSMLTNINILVFVVIPVGIISVTIMFSGKFGLYPITFSLLIISFLSFIVLNNIIEGMIPKELCERPPMRVFIYTIVFAFLASIMVYVIFLRRPYFLQEFISNTPYSFALMLYIALLLTTLPAAIYYELWLKRSEEFIFALPLISRTITEEVRKGKTPRLAISSLMEFNMGKRVNDFIRALTARTISGFSIKEALHGVRIPWLSRMFFELVDIADKTSADPNTLELLSTFMSSAISIKKLINDRSLSFKVAASIALIALAIGVHIVIKTVGPQFKAIATSIQHIRGYSGLQVQFPISPLPPDQIPLLIQIGYTIVVINAILLGMLSGKLIHGSLAYGLKTAIIFSTIAIVTIILLNTFSGLLPII